MFLQLMFSQYLLTSLLVATSSDCRGATICVSQRKRLKSLNLALSLVTSSSNSLCEDSAFSGFFFV
jgi:hypothetical protein